LLIGLQSGNGLHPDRTVNCQNFMIAKNRRNLVLQELSILAITNFGNSGNVFLPLPLFMFRVFADYAHHTLTVHDLALVTNLFY